MAKCEKNVLCSREYAKQLNSSPYVAARLCVKMYQSYAKTCLSVFVAYLQEQMQPEKAARISTLPRKRSSVKRAQKFFTDDESLPISE